MNDESASRPLRGPARDQFLGLISHELRSPIAVILGFAARARRQHGVSDEVADALDEITRHAQLLQRIIEDMLLLATASSSAAACEPVLVQRELPRITGEFERLNPGVSLTVTVPLDLPPVLAEPVYLQQMVHNFLTNATKYGGLASKGWGVGSRGDVGSESVGISVVGSGPGIPEAELSEVLQPFVRSASTAQLARGVGLGLAVCKRMAEAQGGSIWLNNRPSGGLEAGFSLRTVEPSMHPS